MIPSEYLECSFLNFERRYGTEDAYRACTAWAKDIRDGRKARGLLLEGPPGSGKTHLEIAALREVIQARLTRSLFVNVPEWLNNLKNAYAQLEDASLVPSLRGYDVLVLDDLGSERTGDLARDQLYNVINNRESNDLPTLISTNLVWGELERRLGKPTMSRIRRLCKHVTLNEVRPDYREMAAERTA